MYLLYVYELGISKKKDFSNNTQEGNDSFIELLFNIISRFILIASKKIPLKILKFTKILLFQLRICCT